MGSPRYGGAPGYANAPGHDVAPAVVVGPPPGDAWSSWDGGYHAGTNGLAVATFILSWLFWPAAFVTGVVALASKKRRRQSGRGFAVAGLLFSTLWAVLTVVAVVVGVGAVASGALADFASLSRGTGEDLRGVAVGQCFVDRDNKVMVTDCTLPHDGEVFFQGAVVGTGTVGYPGELMLQPEADALCSTAFQSYVGLPYEASRWQYATWLPDEAAWLEGDRSAVCAVVPYGDEVLDKPVAGSRT